MILLDEKREYEVQRDDAMKLMNLPTWEALQRIDKVLPGKERAVHRLRPGAEQGPPGPGATGTADRAAATRRRRFASTPRRTTASCPRS